MEQKNEEEKLDCCIWTREKALYPKICYNRLFSNCTSQGVNIIKTLQTQCTVFCTTDIKITSIDFLATQDTVMNITQEIEEEVYHI